MANSVFVQKGLLESRGWDPDRGGGGAGEARADLAVPGRQVLGSGCHRGPLRVWLLGSQRALRRPGFQEQARGPEAGELVPATLPELN